ncbi:hypothetical protein GOBAR_AA32742 [Gossypium barbadense]|uniref:DUF4283 domain-containing protein n=1 Tax=Gossypium barbadense TaxID=3634 RepID=A0A2P5WA53_GOSBA|nr:hypothetical protein GOBAR_AA32742 [Gossypium barbadense]
MASEEISLLADELIQLKVKSSLVTPRSSFSFLCSVWTSKNYSPDSFLAQVRSIWKTRRKFKIYTAGQNLFQIVFEDEDDLEAIMNGRPWLFKKQLIIFDRLVEAIERTRQGRVLRDSELQYSITLKAESNIVGRESLQLGMADQRFTRQCLYTEEDDEWIPSLASLTEGKETRVEEEMGNKLHAKLPTKKVNKVIKVTNTQKGIVEKVTEIGVSLTEPIRREETVVDGSDMNITEMGYLGNSKKSR